MRPRPLDRGEPRTAAAARDAASCFNAATASRPWRTRVTCVLTLTRSLLLQCGHGLSTVENFPFGTGFGHPCSASMRPRPLDRGEPAHPGLSEAQQVQLQCGHRLSTVENRSRAPLATS